MKKPNSPCYNCQDRRPGCHGECELFQEYEEHARKYKENYISNKHQAHAGIAPFSQMRQTLINKRRKTK